MQAAGLAEEELARARRFGAPRALGIALRVAGLCQGGKRGLGLLEESVEVLQESPAALERATSLCELGAALRRAKRRADSRPPLREALELAHRCGAQPLAERARTELVASGARPRRVALSGVESLTASELRVCQLAADGLSNADIAQALFVTRRTVETHLGNAYRKLEITSTGRARGRPYAGADGGVRQRPCGKGPRCHSSFSWSSTSARGLRQRRAAIPRGSGDNDRLLRAARQPRSGVRLRDPEQAVLSQVYLPLLTYKRVEGPAGTTLMPGLAEELPEVSSDDRVYALRLREGLVYSDGSPVEASHFEHALRRVLGLGSPAAPLYERIVGAIEYAQRGEQEADIAGIETDDKTRRITIRLDRPYAAFEHVLAVPFATPVPADTPFRDMTKNPPPGTGPFRITESEPDRQFVLERNPRFASLAIGGVPEAKLDRITTKIIADKPTLAQDVLRGKLDYMSDSPPPDLLPTVRQEAADRYEEHLTANTNWFFLNGRLPPFDDARVREAVNYAVDRKRGGAGLRRSAADRVLLPPASDGRLRRGARLKRVPIRRSGGDTRHRPR